MIRKWTRMLLLATMLLTALAFSAFANPATGHAQSVKPQVAGDPILVTWKLTTANFLSDYSIYTSDAGGTHYLGTVINSTDPALHDGAVVMDVNGTNGNYQGNLTVPYLQPNGLWVGVVYAVHGGTRSGNILSFQTDSVTTPTFYLTLT